MAFKQKTASSRVQSAAESEHSSSRVKRTYSPAFTTPEAKRGISVRAVLCFLLCLILPPVGILVMWRAGIFRVRGRILMTLIAFAAMVLIIYWIIPESTPMTYEPVPVKASKITDSTDYDYVDPYDISVLSTPEPTLIPGETAGSGEGVLPLEPTPEG